VNIKRIAQAARRFVIYFPNIGIEPDLMAGFTIFSIIRSRPRMAAYATR